MRRLPVAGPGWSAGRMSFRALTLLTVAAAPFIVTSVLWLRRPSDYLAVYGVAPTALVLAGGAIGYVLFAQSRASQRRSGPG